MAGEDFLHSIQGLSLQIFSVLFYFSDLHISPVIHLLRHRTFSAPLYIFSFFQCNPSRVFRSTCHCKQPKLQESRGSGKVMEKITTLPCND
ncbi:hypothetical protein GDO81_007210 [Engystomops pustulosus]|uniref:Uncharacterized protein n=1 Tax=Engystomops pustulosus TaxID=76066 RepID=A0AAV7C5N9_ENGPU|nr:hypothetical protein GDO81_007210 [Engystomops pustulosus]